MDPTDEIKRFWALGHVTAAEAAIIAVGGSNSDDYGDHDLDLAEIRSGPHTTVDLPALDRYRLSLERWLEELGRDPHRSFPVRLFGEWLRKNQDCPGYRLARDAGLDLRNRRPPTLPDEPEPPGDTPPEPQRPGGRIIPLANWPDFHPWPSVAGLRYYVFNERQNGFDKVVVRRGRRVLIDEDAFFEWVRQRDER